MEPRSSVRKSVSPALPLHSLRYRSKTEPGLDLPANHRQDGLCVPSMVTDMQTARNELKCSCPSTLLTESTAPSPGNPVCMCVYQCCMCLCVSQSLETWFVCLCCMCSCGCLYCVHTTRCLPQSPPYFIFIYWEEPSITQLSAHWQAIVAWTLWGSACLCSPAQALQVCATSLSVGMCAQAHGVEARGRCQVACVSLHPSFCFLR